MFVISKYKFVIRLTITLRDTILRPANKQPPLHVQSHVTFLQKEHLNDYRRTNTQISTLSLFKPETGLNLPDSLKLTPGKCIGWQ